VRVGSIARKVATVGVDLSGCSLRVCGARGWDCHGGRSSDGCDDGFSVIRRVEASVLSAESRARHSWTDCIVLRSRLTSLEDGIVVVRGRLVGRRSLASFIQAVIFSATAPGSQADSWSCTTTEGLAARSGTARVVTRQSTPAPASVGTEALIFNVARQGQLA